MATARLRHIGTVPDEIYAQRPKYDDQVTLFDLWDISVRRRWWIFGVWVATLIAAAFYLLLATPVFESRSVLRIGRFADEPLVPAASVALELTEKYEVDEPWRVRPFLASVEARGDNAVALEVEAESATEAQRFLSQIVREVLQVQQQRYEAARRTQEAGLMAMSAEIESLNEQIARLEEVAATASNDEAVSALVVLQRSSLQTAMPALHEQRLKIQQQLSNLKSYPSELLREPTIAQTPSEPKPELVLTLALVLGGIMGLMAAFFSHFVHEARIRGRQS